MPKASKKRPLRRVPKALIRKRATPVPPPGPRAPIEPLVLRYPEAQVALQVSARELDKLIREGALRSSKIGRMRLVHLDSIKALLAQTSNPAT